MKNKFLMKVIIVFAAVCFLPTFASAMAPTDQGLLGMYSTRAGNYNPLTYYDLDLLQNVTVDREENYFHTAKIQNIDFSSLDSELHNNIGRVPYTAVVWRGSFKVHEEADYDFQYKTKSTSWGEFKIDSECAYRDPVSGDCASNSAQYITMTKHLTAGWHSIKVSHNLTQRFYDARAVFQMKKSSDATFELIPDADLSPVFWSDEEVVIGDSTQRLNYFTAGDGAKGEPDAEIKVDMPTGVAWEDLLKYDVLVTWYNASDCAGCGQIEIKNEISGNAQTVAGTRLTSLGGQDVQYPQLYAKIPTALVDDGGTGKLHFSFKQETGGNFNAGVGIIVPYEDASRPVGNINMQMVAATGYKGMSPALVFELDGTANNTISPIFMFADGETKSEYPGSIRPNYMYMAYGTGTPPGKTTIISDMPGATRVLPESAPLNISDPDTLYPCFGRLGEQFDIVSPGHVPNLAGANNNEGKIDEITIPAGNDWVAFQYYGLDFLGSGVRGGGESGSITGGGILSVPATPAGNKLEVSVIGNGKVVSTNVPGIDCPGDCEEDYADGTVVILAETPDTQNSFAGWSGSGTSCDGTINPSCSLTVSADTNVEVSFQLLLGGLCSSAHTKKSCYEPEIKCYFGSPVNENFDSATQSWVWQCEKDGYSSGTCTTERECAVREVTP